MSNQEHTTETPVAGRTEIPSQETAAGEQQSRDSAASSEKSPVFPKSRGERVFNGGIFALSYGVTLIASLVSANIWRHSPKVALYVSRFTGWASDGISDQLEKHAPDSKLRQYLETPVRDTPAAGKDRPDTRLESAVDMTSTILGLSGGGTATGVLTLWLLRHKAGIVKKLDRVVGTGLSKEDKSTLAELSNEERFGPKPTIGDFVVTRAKIMAGVHTIGLVSSLSKTIDKGLGAFVKTSVDAGLKATHQTEAYVRATANGAIPATDTLQSLPEEERKAVKDARTLVNGAVDIWFTIPIVLLTLRGMINSARERSSRPEKPVTSALASTQPKEAAPHVDAPAMETNTRSTAASRIVGEGAKSPLVHAAQTAGAAAVGV